MITKHLLTLAAAATLNLTACTAQRVVPYRPSPGAPFTEKLARYDYSTYERIPDTPTSAAYRVFLKMLPYTLEHAFWGNWSGSGCRGGRPVDAMDEIFRRHDIAYAEARTIRTMQWADEACVEALRKLDTHTMSPQAIAFRDRSSSFFSNRSLTLIGKPVGAIFGRHESKNCPFQSVADIRELFNLEPEVTAGTPAVAVPQTTVAIRKPACRPEAPGQRLVKTPRPAALRRTPLLAKAD